MSNKRLIGSIIIKNGWAVQSFGYTKYYPLGRPEVLAENLDRWGVDEILISCIDRNLEGPDFSLIKKISDSGITTPIIYSGGIRDKQDAIKSISLGADRIVIDSLLHQNNNNFLEISEFIGSQALIAALPITVKKDNIYWYNYIKKKNVEFSDKLKKSISDNLISELILIDWQNEGSLENNYSIKILEKIPFENIKCIPFGGINSEYISNKLLEFDNVSAIAIGNYLSYKEHAVQNYKNKIYNKPIRNPKFEYLKIGYTYYDAEDQSL